MEGIIGFLANFVDLLVSMFVSLYNIIYFLGWKLLFWTLIAVFIFWLLRRLSCVSKRAKFIKIVSESAKKSGAKFRTIGIPYLSVFFSTEGYDVELEYNSITYRIKFFPGYIRGKAVHMYDIKSAYVMGRWMFSRFEEGKKVFGRKVKIGLDNRAQESKTMNILCFIPEPYWVSEPSEVGGVWEHDMESGKPLDGVYLLEGNLLARNLERLMEGYIDSIIHREQDI